MRGRPTAFEGFERIEFCGLQDSVLFILPYASSYSCQNTPAAVEYPVQLLRCILSLTGETGDAAIFGKSVVSFLNIASDAVFASLDASSLQKIPDEYDTKQEYDTHIDID